MLQQPHPDFVHPVGEFVEKSFQVVGTTVQWRNRGDDEEGYDSKSGKVLVKVDTRYFRPAEVELSLGNPAEAERVLGWKRKVDFESLVKEMVKADLKAAASLVEDQN